MGLDDSILVGGDGSSGDVESIADVTIDPSDSVAQMQAKLDDAGAGATVYIGSGDYEWDGNLDLHNGTTLHIYADTITFADGMTSWMFGPKSDPGEEIEIVLHGVEADGNRSTLGAGDSNYFAYFSGASEFPNIHVRGTGKLHDFRGQAVVYSKVVNGSIEGYEAYNNGIPGNSSNGGDGAYVAASYGVTVEDLYVHDNERHGVSFAGTGTSRNVSCRARGITGHDNGNDTLNSEETEDLHAVGIESRNDGGDGVHFKGTGFVEATVIGADVGPQVNAQSWAGTAADRTGETNDTTHIEADIQSVSSLGTGIRVRGDTGATVVVRGKVVGASGIGVYNEGNIDRMVVDGVVIDGCGRYGVHAGNGAAATAIVQGGSIDDWNQDNDGSDGVGSGGSLGDGCVVSGVRFGTPAASSPNAINLSDGDYHIADGNAIPASLAITLNGTNSITGDNAN